MGSIIMGDSDFSLSDWFEIGKMTGMFNFDAPGLRDTDLTYSEAMQYLGILQEMHEAGALTSESALETLEKVSLHDYFRNLVDKEDEYVEYTEIGTTFVPGFHYRVESRNHHFSDIVVLYQNDKFLVSENGKTTKTYKTKEEAGIYVMKWILIKKD